MKNERILISFDNYTFKHACATLEDICKRGKELSELYKPFNLGVFTKEALTDAIIYQGKATQEAIIKDLEGSQKGVKDIITLGMEANAAQNILHLPYFQKAQAACRALTLEDKRLLTKYISVTDEGKVIFTDVAKGFLKEELSTYITNPKEIKRYNLHTKIIGLLNELFEDGKSPISHYWYFIFPKDNNGKFIYPEKSINYTDF